MEGLKEMKRRGSWRVRGRRREGQCEVRVNETRAAPGLSGRGGGPWSGS